MVARLEAILMSDDRSSEDASRLRAEAEAADMVAADLKTLHSLGYAQELLRRMSGFSNFAISFSMICILAGGDCVSGGQEVVNAVAEGQRAARTIAGEVLSKLGGAQ